MSKEIIITDEGLKELIDELEILKTVKRREISEKIKVALSFGDLSENSEYDEAKNEQGKLESRIAEIEAMLQNVRVLDEDEISTEIVHIGSKVKVLDKEFDEAITYQIVGFTQAAPDEGRISDESPVGKALMGSKVGDTIWAETPQGSFEYEVLEIGK